MILSSRYLDDYIIHGSTELFRLTPRMSMLPDLLQARLLGRLSSGARQGSDLKATQRPRKILPPNTHGLHIPPKPRYFGTRSCPSLLAGHRRTWWTKSVRQSSLLVHLTVRSGLT